MKFIHRHIHRNSATDRTQPYLRMAAVGLAVLISIPVILPAAAVITSRSDREEMNTRIPQEGAVTETVQRDETLLQTHRQGLDRGLWVPLTLSDTEPDTIENEDSLHFESEEGAVHTPDREFYEDLFDPSIPLTQELIARRIETRMDMQVRGGSAVKYPYPAGSMAVDLYKDGRQILKGQVVDIGGTVYVPVQRFADLFGSFKTVYTEATEQVVITGTNLSITVMVGDPYITVNERIFYTGKKVISLGGWIFVPLTSMCKALNAQVTIRSGYYDAFITSGDTTKVKWASEYYDSTDLYWLARIISAEAKGEPFAGQIAVGNVVLNRVRSSQFPNTVKGVIFDTKYGTQFSPTAGGTIYQTPTASAVRAAKICLEGYSLSTSMIYFYNPSIATSSWIGRTRPYIMTIGNHKFYG